MRRRGRRRGFPVGNGLFAVLVGVGAALWWRERSADAALRARTRARLLRPRPGDG